MTASTSFRCRHIFTEGRQCGSPALRGEALCFYHHGSRHPILHETIHSLTFIALPAPEDLHAIQRGICEVLRLAANYSIDHKHASMLLRGLAIASANLARIARQQRNAPAPELVEDYIHDPILGTLAPEPGHVAPPEPLPDQTPIRTPQPIIQYTPTPEQAAFNDARWAKLEGELAAHTIAHPRPRQLPETRLAVQTYPIANEDFGPEEKIISATTQPRLQASDKKHVLHLAKEDQGAKGPKEVESCFMPDVSSAAPAQRHQAHH